MTEYLEKGGITMAEINRIWLNVNTDNNKITLFGRPRISIHVDEYIWSLIEENIVKPHKLMRSEKQRYLLKIAFQRFDPVRHKYYPLSPYNGQLRQDENITPREYADFLFDGIGAALVFNFKRLKREEFDGLKSKIDWSIVESFPFPASFDDQQYIGDEGKIHVYSWDGRQETTLVGPYSVRELYLEHFGE